MPSVPREPLNNLTLPPGIPKRSTAHVALYMLGAPRGEAVAALRRYGYRDGSAKLFAIIFAADDLFGKRVKVIADVGATADEFAAQVAARSDRAYLIIATPRGGGPAHAMASYRGRLWNKCGHGGEPVQVAVEYRVAHS